MPRTGKTFVLVHGAWRGGWCYVRLAEILRAKGHRVYVPTLTGLGERSHLLSPAINMTTHVQDIIKVLIFEDLEEVILCGHSYGGLVATGVADTEPGRIGGLVYIDAYVGGDRTSVFDLDTPEAVSHFIAHAQEHGGHYLQPIPARNFNVRPENQAWVDRKCTPQPLATFMERRPLTQAARRNVKRSYVLATDWQGSPFHRQCAAVDGTHGWNVFRLHCGHDIMVDEPGPLGEILDAAA